MITYGLSHIQLTVRDVVKSRRFYAELFNMSVIESDHEVAILRSPGTKEIITLFVNPKRQDQAGKMGGIRHFGFRLREPYDMDAVVKQVTELGGTPVQHGLRGEKNEEPYAIFSDPDGYEVEVFFQPE